MMYVTVPRKPRVSSKADLDSFNDVMTLLSKHGFGVAHFSNDGVSFYDRRMCMDDTVPISSFFKMTKKEFLIFVDVLKRLQESDRQKEEMVRFINQVI